MPIEIEKEIEDSLPKTISCAWCENNKECQVDPASGMQVSLAKNCNDFTPETHRIA